MIVIYSVQGCQKCLRLREEFTVYKARVCANCILKGDDNELKNCDSCEQLPQVVFFNIDGSSRCDPVFGAELLANYYFLFRPGVDRGIFPAAWIEGSGFLEEGYLKAREILIPKEFRRRRKYH